MKILSIRRVVRLAGLILPLAWVPGAALAQAPSAQSYGVAVSTATVSQTIASAVAPAEGGMVSDQANSADIAGLVSAQDASAIASGFPDDASSDAVSSATLGAVSVLNGLITADGVVAMATSTVAGSNAAGSSLANLVVNGVPMSSPAPNTRVNLPGGSFAVLNERIASASGITVNMIRVVLREIGRAHV